MQARSPMRRACPAFDEVLTTRPAHSAPDSRREEKCCITYTKFDSPAAITRNSLIHERDSCFVEQPSFVLSHRSRHHA